ncbi:hypothetical protein H310_14641 [Aphanomyces invadans]|uniref:Retrotransposon gag domain-containing protein n=1 Tax=Aphanomyces invadans TaxID=157072 RepID=A0A024T8X0_9STRA|nr:hypothetical protein H310_14641 [Aphanomyces invadans]ETV90605.1 hypothetical protein H310_14641 [Aphanomyces invadans]|eukprot:XP_008880758.1 hypothetical protein H310_14641 [Aphanomyces invadans]
MTPTSSDMDLSTAPDSVLVPSNTRAIVRRPAEELPGHQMQLVARTGTLATYHPTTLTPFVPHTSALNRRGDGLLEAPGVEERALASVVPFDRSHGSQHSMPSLEAPPAPPVSLTDLTLTTPDSRADLDLSSGFVGSVARLEASHGPPAFVWEASPSDQLVTVTDRARERDSERALDLLVGVPTDDVNMGPIEEWRHHALTNSETDEMEVEEEQTPSPLTTIMLEISDRIEALQNWTMMHEPEITNLARETTNQLSTLRASTVDHDNRLGELARRLSDTENLISVGLSDSIRPISERTSLLNDDLHTTRSEFAAQLSNLHKEVFQLRQQYPEAASLTSQLCQDIQLLRDRETPRDLVEAAVNSQKIAISDLALPLQQQLESGLPAQEAHISTTLSSLCDRVESLGRGLNQSASNQKLHVDESRRHIAALQESNTQLQELVTALSNEKGLLQNRIQLLETRIDQQQLDFAARLDKLESKTLPADTTRPHLQPAAMSKMTTELEDVKDAQLLDQATRCQFDDEERKLLMGLKLSADKTHPNLNKWWISYSKTKNGDVWTEILADFMDQFCCRTAREMIDRLFEESDRYEGESVRAYAIRLQTILDEVDIPALQGVTIFQRGVRHPLVEACLENTDKELLSISDCMKLLQSRQIRLDNPPNLPRMVRSESASTTASTLSSLRTPPRSPDIQRRGSKVGFEDQSTLEKLLGALMTQQQQQQQQAFVTHIEKADRVQQTLLEAFMKSNAAPRYAAPIQPTQPSHYAASYSMASHPFKRSQFPHLS